MKITVTITTEHLDPEGETKGAALNRPATKFAKEGVAALLNQFPQAQVIADVVQSGDSAFAVKITGGGKGLDLQTRTDYAVDAIERVYCDGGFWN